ncbi:arginase family protein [Candidatus Nitrosotenuis uzonensis]|uniref:Amidinohydrolase n=1 Tax=Candidatus Nitrosotenuis uzonensis TaxID=1407055 RepID=A0A812F4Q5_9ARCH|nr:arginase family protein [Candidatus Nitrosotenuis uzonensis]MCA2004086.1 arginase family protein [Candidatus Nitrosotenuis sp.]CAE6497325.1 Amidinohydrolase [Candidatus Nitrosotenuis uzonensis]
MKKGKKDLKICWANAKSIEQSDIIVIGIPDESGSHSVQMGTAMAPDTIRKISNTRDVYYEKEFRCLAHPVNGLGSVKIYDYGNIKKSHIAQTFESILSFPKIPISIGGDHSITTHILKAFAKKYGKISLVYFDAHPDFVSHTRNYYGSVITDSLDYIDVKTSLQIGIRSPEEEEITNLKKSGLNVITPFDIVEKGVNYTSKLISDTIKENTYISFDMDCLDPAYAPGVSVPVPMGLHTQDAVYFIKKITSKMIGMDIMEVCPAHDLNNVTSHLASRLIGETISTCKV